MKVIAKTIQNTDANLIFAEDRNITNNCLERALLRSRFLGGEIRVGTLWLWDAEMQMFDTCYDFHAWTEDSDGSVNDSYAAIEATLAQLDAQGKGFGLTKSVGELRVLKVNAPKFMLSECSQAQVQDSVTASFGNIDMDGVYLNGWIQNADQYDEIVDSTKQDIFQ
jgi:hypothetical protein